ncbi:MAG: fatty acid desaturase [Bdellovibrio sp.]|nr:fatty acid desaturase [Bdellovibrio sp.]
MQRTYPILFWRPFYDFFSIALVIGVAVYLSVAVSWWFYPLSALLIANRLLALSLLCHEGLHGTLSRHRRFNDFFGRYLCAYPTMISFNKYRRVHLLHHGSVGSENWDPDRHLYVQYPENAGRYLSSMMWQVITLKNAYSFFQYYTDLPDLFKILTRKMRPERLHKSNDVLSFLIFYILLFVAVVASGLSLYFVLLYLVPVIFIMQPYVILMGGLQHGPVRSQDAPGGPSRTVVGSRIYMWLLLPLNINYHAEHHQEPAIPHYWLRDFSEDQARAGQKLWQDSYCGALRALFKP